MIKMEEKKYRTRVDIVADVLEVVKERRTAKKTHIMYGAELSYKLLRKYLKMLVPKLLKEDEETYTATEECRNYLQLYGVYEEEFKKLETHTNKEKNRLSKMRGELERMISN